MYREGKLRAIYSMAVTGTLASIVLAGAFPDLASFLPIGSLWPISHILSAFFVFSATLIVFITIVKLFFRFTLKRAELKRLHSSDVRRIVRDVANAFQIRFVALRSGGPLDGHISALIVKGHSIIRVGTGALPLAIRRPEDLRFRIVHEAAHLKARDPLRDQLTLASYLSGALLTSIALYEVLKNVISSVFSYSGSIRINWTELWQTDAFVVGANLVYFGMVGVALVLERLSGMRIREFHADRVATDYMGSEGNTFGDHVPRADSTIRSLLIALVGSHPSASQRREAQLEETSVFSADSILFFLQSYFSAFLLELLLQLLFTNASETIVGVSVRRQYIVPEMTRYPLAYSLTIISILTLISAAYAIVVDRSVATVLARRLKTRHARIERLMRIILLIVAGSITALGSSQAVLWGLKQTGWSLTKYISYCADLLLVHASAAFGFSLSTAAVFFLPERLYGSRVFRYSISLLPTFFAFTTGMFLYFR